jgi:hypothetical protein
MLNPYNGNTDSSASKGEVKLSLCLIKHYAMKTWGPFLTLTLGGGEWSASCPSCFTPPPPPEERAPGTNGSRGGGGGGGSAGLVGGGKRKNGAATGN